MPFHLLKDVPSLACGESGGGDLIVQGDNFVALKALLPYYAGQVKCIYIDPPYNTGNENWVYNDNVNSPMIRSGRPHTRFICWIGNNWSCRFVDKSFDSKKEPRWFRLVETELKIAREVTAERVRRAAESYKIAKAENVAADLPEDGIDLHNVIGSLEKDLIVKALERTGSVRSKAAQLLGLNRTTLIEKIKKMNIT